MPIPTITNVSATLGLLKALQNADVITVTARTRRAPASANAETQLAHRDQLRDVLERRLLQDAALAGLNRRHELRNRVAEELGMVSPARNDAPMSSRGSRHIERTKHPSSGPRPCP